jgi:hypothetical protein
MRRILVLLALLALPSLASAREAWRGFCEDGDQSVVTSGISSTTKVQRSYPRCTVLILVHGGAVATIYADNNGTPLANPFQANLDGSFVWYADDGRYDQQISGANLAAPFTFLDILLCDPFVPGAVCAGGTGNSHNLLSTTHLDTIPFSPPVRGDLIVAQNQTSPTGVNPAWARLALGTTNYVLTSNGTDAIWAPVAAGGGCTPPGTNTGILSEHPVGTCFDSLDATWDDTNQNLQFGDGSNTRAGTNVNTFTHGVHNALTDITNANIEGDHITLLCDSNTMGTSNCARFNVDGSQDTITATGASSHAFNIYIGGRGNGVTATGGGFADSIRLQTDTSTASATLSGNINVDFSEGLGNTISSTGTGSSTHSIYQKGESLQALSSAGGENLDNFQLGEVQTLNATNASSVLGFITLIGFNHSFTSSAGAAINNGFALGHANTVPAGSTTMTDFGMVGHSLQLSNCTDCFAFGKNISQTGVSNSLFLGMSGTPGLIITNSAGSNDNVRRTPLAFGSLPACAAGTEGSFAAINDSTTTTIGATITGGSSGHVLGYCAGTNWKVAAN